MPLANQDIAALLIKKLGSSLSPEEELALREWTGLRPENKVLAEEFLDEEKLRTGIDAHWIEERVWGRIRSAIQAEQPAPVRKLGWSGWKKFAAAAAIVGVIGGAGYLYFVEKPGPVPQTQATRFKNDVAPGGNKAVLTLAGGREIVLDSAHIGKIADQKNSSIVKPGSGQLVYEPDHTGSREIQYNLLSTPRGGQYQLTLSDGTRVWLNAASSIRYPTAFTGKERLVEITGEAYFEVVHNMKMPFKVKAANQTIEDVGTAFNVNAYPDEQTTRTTLVEGSVKVASQGNDVDLRPGQQSQLNRDGTITLNDKINIAEVTAWKNGVFKFQDAGIESIMRQMSRWYDVQVVYETKPGSHFVADIPRDVPVSELLKLLELTREVHFKIDGKKITVMQ